MTVLMIVGLILLFIVVPYLAGNIYGFLFRKKEMGIVSTYIAGMAVVYACLTAIQFIVIKFKFNFSETSKVYTVFFVVCAIVGMVALVIRGFKDKALRLDIIVSKRSVWIFFIIILQGILYIGLKNPYFEDNALLETARVTLETGTIYEYNAFTGLEVQAGFPLSNKLMFLPVLYAYISSFSGVDLALMFNFVMPVVTFISFYMVMLLWVQRLSKDYGQKWELWLVLLVWVVQVGDGFSHATAFRVLHSGYTGEAIFFGVLLTYALYAIKNKSYLIALGCIATFPGLVKYDLLIDFVKRFGEYWKAAALGGGALLVYILAVVYMFLKSKKIKTEMLNLNLTITYAAAMVWDKMVKEEVTVSKKIIHGGVVLVMLLLCGNIMIVSNATSFRSNPYGANEKEYELLQVLEEKMDKDAKVAACDEVAKWMKRMGVKNEPVIGFDLAGRNVAWYSYEEYDEAHIELWKSLNYASSSMEQDLEVLAEKIDMDYIVVRRVTDYIPIVDNELIKCVYDSPDYIVYFVDKK